MKKILGILPHSIGGRLTISSIFDGFEQNDYKVIIFDELKNNNFENFLNDNFEYIVGYDFSPIKLKVDYNLKFPCISYFSDVIQDKTSGLGYIEYQKYIKSPDIFVFYWDRELAKKENLPYMSHFVNTNIYKNFSNPKYDVLFMGRLDTKLRLETFIKLNKRLPHLTFGWYAIEKHYLDALSRINNEDKKIITKTYKGFIDNEKDMAKTINDYKIVYNINSQGISSLNYRSIQTLACQRLLISDERDELDLFDNIIPTYKTFDELVLKIDFYIKNKNEYKKITKKGREMIERNHNSKLCVKKMLELKNELQF